MPQVLLPVLPHLQDELTVETEGKRLAAVELLCKLFSQPSIGGDAMKVGPGLQRHWQLWSIAAARMASNLGASPVGFAKRCLPPLVMQDYTLLFDDLCKRFQDTRADVRMRLVGHAPALVARCRDKGQMVSLLHSVQQRLADQDERVRATAVRAACEVLAVQGGGGPAAGLLDAVLLRLRDKKTGVRREAASRVGRLLGEWVGQCEAGAPGAPDRRRPLTLAIVLAGLAVRDPELGPHMLESVFSHGLFPRGLPEEAQARWWAALWQQASASGQESLAQMLRGQAAMQAQVQELLRLRAALREARASSLAGDSSMAGAGASGSAGAAAGGGGDIKAALAARIAGLAATLQHELGPKAEEGLTKLWEQKDNHVFRGLQTLAAYGCPLKEATVAGRDVQQRVGSRGPAAEAARALIARMTPAILAPEVLHTAVEQAESSQEGACCWEGQTTLVATDAAAPWCTRACTCLAPELSFGCHSCLALPPFCSTAPAHRHCGHSAAAAGAVADTV